MERYFRETSEYNARPKLSMRSTLINEVNTELPKKSRRYDQNKRKKKDIRLHVSDIVCQYLDVLKIENI